MSKHTDEPDDEDREDPLEGAAIGEKRTVRRSKTYKGIDHEPWEFVRKDAESDVHIADVEIIEGGDGECDDFKVVWEAEMMKTLPRDWDQVESPDASRPRVMSNRMRALLQAAATTLVMTVALLVSFTVSSQAFSDLTINGEPMFVGDVWAFAGPAFLLAVGVVVVQYLMTRYTQTDRRLPA